MSEQKLNNKLDDTTNSSIDKQITTGDCRILVIGASHAGISFVDQMRKYGFDGSLTLIDRQKGGPMERPPLSKGFLLETDDKVNPMFLLRRGKWYKEKNINLKQFLFPTQEMPILIIK